MPARARLCLRVCVHCVSEREREGVCVCVCEGVCVGEGRRGVDV